MFFQMQGGEPWWQIISENTRISQNVWFTIAHDENRKMPTLKTSQG
jgi:hypothetical protein